MILLFNLVQFKKKNEIAQFIIFKNVTRVSNGYCIPKPGQIRWSYFIQYRMEYFNIARLFGNVDMLNS